MSSLSRKKRERVKPEMNVTPLVDVVLVLLIIFMVILPAAVSDQNLELAKMENPDEQRKGEPEPYVLSIDVDGRLYLDDYGVAKEPWHARFVLRVVEGQTCVGLTPDGEVLRETLGSPPFRQVIHGTSAHNLPVPLGKKQGHPVYRFERAVSDARARSLEDKAEL